MKRTADRLFGDQYRWSVLGAGRNQLPIASMSAAMGGNVRVGLEDSLWLGPGKLAESNAAQVRAVRQIIEAMGLEVASPDDARQHPGAQGPRRRRVLSEPGGGSRASPAVAAGGACAATLGMTLCARHRWRTPPRRLYNMFGFTAPVRRERHAVRWSTWRRSTIFGVLLPRFDPFAPRRRCATSWPTSASAKDPNRRAAARAARCSTSRARIAARRAACELRRPASRRRSRSSGAIGGRPSSSPRGSPGPSANSCVSCEHDRAAARWREYVTPLFLLRLFQHRQVEFLLQPFVNDAPDSGTGPSSTRPTSTRIRSGF